MRGDGEACARVRGGKAPVGIKTGQSGGGTFRKGPLLRTARLEGGPGKAGYVEIAAAGGFAVFVPDRFRGLVGKQAQGELYMLSSDSPKPKQSVERRCDSNR